MEQSNGMEAQPSLGERIVYCVVGALLGLLLGVWSSFRIGVDVRIALFLCVLTGAVAGFRWGARVPGILNALFWC